VNSGAELVEACGIYIENEFVGAVVDGESIESQLKTALEKYREEENIIEVDYAVVPDLKQGVYRSEALVNESDMKEFLTGEKEVVTEYTPEEEISTEKIAEDFDMSVEEVKEHNPKISDAESIESGESIKIKEAVSVLPVKYVCEEQEEEIIELDAFEYNDENELVSQGIKGKKLSTFEVTYIDGQEVNRKLKDTETIEFPSEVDSLDNQQTDSEVIYSESIPDTENIFSGDFVWPVNGGYISDPFGSDRNHKGLDIAAPAGTEIFAADGGTVVEAGWNDGGYGYLVMIDHGNGYVTLYGHASEVYVNAGDTVAKGQLIAAVGTTGDSTGNHCHFEVRYNGGFLDPENFV
jgi:murein DD-endopeptidase MepM/ murein hydrolase activator NlpD